MSRIPKPQEIYKHFKGNLYQIITVANHSETGEQLVIYQALYGDYKVYARELSMFTSLVDREKYPNATQEYRFELQPIGNAANTEDASCKKEEHTKEVLSSTVSTAAKMPENEVAKADASSEEINKADTDKMKVDKADATKVESAEEEANLDPMLLQFLDADGYEEKLNVLAALHHRITQDMITIMAVASDVEVAEGELEERYAQLRNCLLTLEKYECNRMR
ncbi:MAG: DUF1653 domain-containing protein [Lachnospiraceae bacterium]|nr:DUF1653 domain-containing protein [Lachnospiraceae bacterium]MBR6149948.1 DUF1653 domain-containing protein [Lachnospiraceae bacterium]